MFLSACVCVNAPTTLSGRGPMRYCDQPIANNAGESGGAPGAELPQPRAPPATREKSASFLRATQRTKSRRRRGSSQRSSNTDRNSPENAGRHLFDIAFASTAKQIRHLCNSARRRRLSAGRCGSPLGGRFATSGIISRDL